LNNLGSFAVELADYDRAVVLHEEALALRREIGDQWAIANSLRNLGNVAAAQGRYERATARHAEALALRRALGDKSGIADSLKNLGNVAAAQGDFGQAGTLYEECLRLGREIGAKDEIAESLEGMAWVAAARGEAERAAWLGGAAEAQRQALGTFVLVDQQACHAQTVRTLRGALGESAFASAWAAGQALAPEDAVALALSRDSS
jgi:tetratricopeptide (TPR) repeat protein